MENSKKNENFEISYNMIKEVYEKQIEPYN